MTTRPRAQRVQKSPHQGDLFESLSKVGVPLTVPGSTGLKHQAGQIDDEWHKKLTGKKYLKEFREMHDNDPILGSFNFVVRSQIFNAPREVEARNDSNIALMQRDHVRTCLDDMSSTMEETIGDVLSMIWAGWSYHGIQYKIRRGPKNIAELRSQYDDGLVGWRKLPIRSQDTIERWDIQDDGGIAGAEQMAPPKYKTEYLPIEQCLLFRTENNKSNPQGRSLYRNAWRSYRFLRTIQDLEAIGIERDMAGVLVFFMPVEYLASDASADQQDTVSKYREIVEKARRGEHEGLVFPTREDDQGKTGFDLELLQSGGRRPIDTNEIIKRLESRIAISVLGESVLLGQQGDVGSWALASSKTQIMALVIKGLMTSIEAVFNRYAIPRLIDANGWPTKESPSLKFGDIETDVSPELAAALTQYTSAGLLTPDRTIEDYLRRRLGLPINDNISAQQIQDAVGLAEEQGESPTAIERAVEATIPIAEQMGTPSSMLGGQP